MSFADVSSYVVQCPPPRRSQATWQATVSVRFWAFEAIQHAAQEVRSKNEDVFSSLFAILFLTPLSTCS